MYNPTTSTSFSSKRGWAESLKRSTFQGRSSWSRHMRATVSLPTPGAGPANASTSGWSRGAAGPAGWS